MRVAERMQKQYFDADIIPVDLNNYHLIYLKEIKHDTGRNKIINVPGKEGIIRH